MDHPRIRGEHFQTFMADIAERGSSPHTRGALMRFPADEDAVGIIPAYAGSTHISQDPCGANRDHPRIRGEHRNFRFPAMARIGSSPHTRGARNARLIADVGAGIIPAYAGSTKAGPPMPVNSADHPRIRGEHR